MITITDKVAVFLLELLPKVNKNEKIMTDKN